MILEKAVTFFRCDTQATEEGCKDWTTDQLVEYLPRVNEALGSTPHTP